MVKSSSGWPGYEAELEAVALRLEGVRERWPLGVGQDDRVPAHATVPFLFREAFPSVTGDQITTLALAHRLLDAATPTLDGPVGAGAGGGPSDQLRGMILQAEAYRVLHALFPPSAAFWDHYRDYLADLAGALLERQRFTNDARTWSEYTKSTALHIAMGEGWLARAMLAGLVELAGDPVPLALLVESLNNWLVAARMFDDLRSWKQDLRRGTPSLLLARAASRHAEAAREDDEQKRAAILAREIYYGGIATEVIDIAIDCVNAAERYADRFPGLSFYRTTTALRQSCEILRRDVVRIVDANRARAARARRISLPTPEVRDPWSRLAWDGLRFIHRQWELGFGEVRDLVRFHDEAGLGPGQTCYSGDVFQRALIADALCDGERVLGKIVEPLVMQEIEYLMERRLTVGIGGWSYLLDLPELPPDVDDLAQVMQVLLRTGRRAVVAEHCEGPLAVLLRDNMHPEGSFETWIIPALGRSPLEERQAKYAEWIWGAGPDCGAIPNLLYALWLYDAPRFGEIVRRGIAFLVGRQAEDGYWHSAFYADNYYATFACVRLLAAVDPGSTAVARALQLLRATQYADGSWGTRGGAVGDALNTAFALLALAAGQRGAAGAEDRGRAMAALEYLDRTRQPDDSWPSSRFIHVSGGRYIYGSRTMTTTFVMKAAFAWHASVQGSGGVDAPVHSAAR